MKKISKISFLKNKKQLQELMKLGKQYDKEKDPEKKAALEKEIIQRCDVLKGKLNLKDCSDKEAQELLGVGALSPSDVSSKRAKEKALLQFIVENSKNGCKSPFLLYFYSFSPLTNSSQSAII